MLGDGGTALEFTSEEGVNSCPGDTPEGEAAVGIEILVFGGQCCLPDIFGETIQLDRGAALVGKNFIEKTAPAVENFG